MVAVRVLGASSARRSSARPDTSTRIRSPKSPRDLTGAPVHPLPDGRGGPVYRWEFEKRGGRSTVAVSGPLDSQRRRAHCSAPRSMASGSPSCSRSTWPTTSRRGALVRVLEDWCPPFTASSSTTRAGATSRPRSRRSSRRSACDAHGARGCFERSAQAGTGPGATWGRRGADSSRSCRVPLDSWPHDSKLEG